MRERSCFKSVIDPPITKVLRSLLLLPLVFILPKILSSSLPEDLLLCTPLTYPRSPDTIKLVLGKASKHTEKLQALRHTTFQRTQISQHQMSRHVATNADRRRHQSERSQATGREHYHYCQTVGPHWSDSEREDDPVAPPRHGHGWGVNVHGEPLSPPPPYSEQDNTGARATTPSKRLVVKRYASPGGFSEFVEYSSGRKDRDVMNGDGSREPWPYTDHEDTSDDGSDHSGMINLTSGRRMPRSEWEDQDPTQYSSEEVEDDEQPETSPSHHGSRPQQRRRRIHHSSSEDYDADLDVRHNSSSEDDDSDREVPTPRSEGRGVRRYRGRQSLARRGGRGGHGDRETPRHLGTRARRL